MRVLLDKHSPTHHHSMSASLCNNKRPKKPWTADVCVCHILQVQRDRSGPGRYGSPRKREALFQTKADRLSLHISHAESEMDATAARQRGTTQNSSIVCVLIYNCKCILVAFRQPLEMLKKRRSTKQSKLKQKIRGYIRQKAVSRPFFRRCEK